MAERDRPARGGSPDPAIAPWRARLHEIIFEADTPAGKAFDLVLLVAILLSVLAVLLDSVPEINVAYHPQLVVAEWIFTGLFTVEYLLRLLSVRRSMAYALSFFGIIDLLSILPTWLALVLPGAQQFLVLRILRLLRVFRVLKLARYINAGDVLISALRASRVKITVFVMAVLMLVTILGSVMYLLEGHLDGSAFTSIPAGIYWAIVTLSTVGYGDIVPETVVGQMISAAIMLLGYGIIAVPTGIVTAEMTRGDRQVDTTSCPNCSAEGHRYQARYCYRCGAELHPDG